MPRSEAFAVGLSASGLALAVLDLAGATLPFLYRPSVAQAGLHAAMAGAGALLLLADAEARPALARALGLALLALGALGAVSPALFGAGPRLGIGLETLENLAHALLGAWGAWAARGDEADQRRDLRDLPPERPA